MKNRIDYGEYKFISVAPYACERKIYEFCV